MLVQSQASALELVELCGVDRLTVRRLGPGRAARLGARLLATRLDVRLARGADPADSALLAARAGRLGSRGTRRELAGALEGIIDAANRPRRRWWSLVHEDPIRGNADALLGLAVLLDSERALYVRGVAALSALIGDGTGPLYRRHVGALSLALRNARHAMTGEDRTP